MRPKLTLIVKKGRRHFVLELTSFPTLFINVPLLLWLFKSDLCELFITPDASFTVLRTPALRSVGTLHQPWGHFSQLLKGP